MDEASISSQVPDSTITKKILREKSFMEPDVKHPFGHKLKLTFLDKVKVSKVFM